MSSRQDDLTFIPFRHCSHSYESHLNIQSPDWAFEFQQYLYLNAIMAEELASIRRSGHLKAGSSAPHRRLPYKERKGAALATLVTLTKYVWTHKQNRIHGIISSFSVISRKDGDRHKESPVRLQPPRSMYLLTVYRKEIRKWISHFKFINRINRLD